MAAVGIVLPRGTVMPSPFPGMDPFLEGSRWIGVHSQLCAEIARQLAPRLRPKYVALTNECFILATPEDVAITGRSVYPDTGVIQASAAILPPTFTSPS